MRHYAFEALAPLANGALPTRTYNKNEKMQNPSLMRE
jgi:hypothetical protein